MNIFIWAAFLASQIYISMASSNTNCHCFPGDNCWPSESAWNKLNGTVEGRLIATVPIGTPCHDPNYNEAGCAELQSQWYTPPVYLASSSSVMQTYFANQSCDPFTPRSQPCLLGNYVRYAVNASSSEDVVATINFARENNIRFVIRNTGHDCLGRSTGAGSLAVWTQHLKDIDFLDWSDSFYQGPAMKMGAGILDYEALEAAAQRDLVVVAGDCTTVGLIGGFTQGGGHSSLSTSFGLGADQTLEFEVATASGDIVIASRNSNSDLYWALSGGGPGNYGVVLSMTVRAYPDAVIGGATLEFAAVDTTDNIFYEAIAEFHSLLPKMLDSGASVVYEFDTELFLIDPVTAYNQTSEQVQAILAPFVSVLNNLSIPFSVSYNQCESYLDHYSLYEGPLPYGSIGVADAQYGGRLIPRSVLEDNNADLQSVLRNLTANGVVVVGSGLDVSAQTDSFNAVLPAWRTAAVQMQLVTVWNETAPWSLMVSQQWQMTDEFMPQIEAVTPGSGAYMNEADFRQPHFQETFFGVNYLPLLGIKQKWDPDWFFYVNKGVGSDSWSLSESGRMCWVG